MPLMNWKRYWDIILYRTYAELKSEAQMNYMGYVWWLLEPLLNTGLFYAILILVMRESSAGALSFILVGAIIWQWFQGAVMQSVGTILDSGAMLRLVYLPKIILPIISILASTWRFAFLFLLLLLWIMISKFSLAPALLAIPILLLLQFAVILAFSLPIAALMPYFPDARLALDISLRSLMLISGIFYSVEEFQQRFTFGFSQPDGDLGGCLPQRIVGWSLASLVQAYLCGCPGGWMDRGFCVDLSQD
ncbi:MAG: ABC transporter permease [Blastochloris sp.]|nr:ABC transporter permease [Blastochloris sp.]